MASLWNGSGQVVRSDGTRTGTTVWAQAKAAGQKITTSGHDTHDQGLADSIEKALNLDGENSPTTNIDWNNNKITNIIGITDNDGDTQVQVEETSDEDKVRIDAAGTEVAVFDANGLTLPVQPSFLVYNSAAQTNLTVNTTVDVEFDTEIFDRNADYNTTTYTFTAPVTGIYQFNAQVNLSEIDNLTALATIVLVTSNRTYSGTRFDPLVLSADPTAVGLTLCVLADMDAADTAKIQLTLGAGGVNIADIPASTAGAMTSHFSGYLVA